MYSNLPNNFTFIRPEDPNLVAAVAVASNQQNSYENLMNTYQNLVQQPSAVIAAATLSSNNCNPLSTSSVSLTGLNGGIGARECTACGHIYDYELEKDLRGYR